MLSMECPCQGSTPTGWGTCRFCLSCCRMGLVTHCSTHSRGSQVGNVDGFSGLRWCRGGGGGTECKGGVGVGRGQDNRQNIAGGGGGGARITQWIVTRFAAVTTADATLHVNVEEIPLCLCFLFTPYSPDAVQAQLLNPAGCPIYYFAPNATPC